MATTHTHDPRATTSGRGLTRAVRDLTADRVLGIVGAVLVLVSTGLSWYAQRVTLTLGGLTQQTISGFSLWDVRNVAAWVLVAGAAVGVFALLLQPGREWRGGMAAAVAGLGIQVYSAVAMVDLPALASGTLARGSAAATVATRIDVGPFVALLGGLLLLVGGLAASNHAARAARPL
jgi:hypothetical protein